ncbi:unnamed protein product [Symbiodinium sp. CCMP2456]|nr:unnamed protein product [Symbiodinium sp. CCMP2456]
MEEYFEKRRAGKISKEDKFMVLCTQPRRIACISLANRVASCIKETVGDSIGYKISGDSKVRPGRTKLVYVTTGYLLQVLVNNPEQISSYSHLILDEVHERDVDSDLLSLVVKLQMSGYNFKLVIMSATLQGDLFTRYFSEKKIKTIFVGVKRYPVEVVHIEQLLDRFGGRSGDFMMKSEGTRGYQAPFAGNAYRAIKDAERAFGTGGREAEGWEEENVKVKGEFDSDSDDESGDSDFSAEETAAVAKAMAAPKRRRKEVSPNIIRGLDTLVYELVLRVAQPGEGILVFLPGIGEISELQEVLMPLEDVDQQAHMNWSPGLERNDLHFKVFVLHSLIPKDEQEGAVFDPPPPDTAHIILASNIAESSLTIPKVRIVIDFGLRRQLIYDKRRHMSCLVTTWVSQASAKQRCGRTGRVFEGVNIRLYTKQFFESYMDEFDPPEMQTAPLEKLYVNVKHLSAKLPAYQVTPTEFRKRTPKELLMLVAQPPEESAIASSIENLDQLGALTSDSESAELTVLGYLMMAVPLDVQLCRLVIFGALLGMPCEGVVCAAATSVQDPFTLPSHLIMKDPKEYAEAVRRSYESRKYFDHGHWSEPLMLRNLFVHFLLEFRKMQIDKCNRRGRVGRESTRSAFTRCAQLMASKFAVVPKRLVNLANAILDTATRMRKFLPEGSALLKQLESLLSLLQAGERVYSSVEAAEEALPKVTDLFCSDAWKLKALLVMAFTPQFMRGGTKVRAPDQQVTVYTKKKKQTATKEKNKMEILLQEIVDLGLDPTRTVACVLELPRGKGGVRMSPRFTDDLHLTVQMITGEGFQLVMAKDNRVLISFEDAKKQEDEEADGAESSLRPRPKPDPFASIKTEPCCTLSEEVGLVSGISTGAHYIDLFGAGRWKFPVNLLSSLKKEQEERARRKAAEAEAKRKAAAEAEAKRKAEEKAAKKAKKAALQEAANASPKSRKDEDSNKVEDPEVKAEAAEAQPPSLRSEAMADYVEQALQDMVPELDDLRRRKVFSEDELRHIVRRRREFEYTLQRNPGKPQDYLNYVRYEIALEALRRRRTSALRWRKYSISTVAGLRRIHNILHRGSHRFKGDLQLWYQHVDFCLRSGSTAMLTRVLMRAVKYHPKEVHLWLLAADRELQQGHVEAARKLLLRGLRCVPTSVKLLVEFLRLEVGVAGQLLAAELLKQEEDTEAKTEAGTKDVWAPSRLLFRKAVAKLEGNLANMASYLAASAQLLHQAQEKWSTSSGLSEWAESLRAAAATSRPGVGHSSRGQEEVDAPATTIWEVWWTEELRAGGKSWSDLAPVIAECSIGAVIAKAVEAMWQQYQKVASGKELHAPLLAMAKSPAAVSDVDAVLKVLETFSAAVPSLSDEAVKAAVEELRQRSALKYPGNLRLGLIASSGAFAAPEARSEEAAMACASLLKVACGASAQDSACLLQAAGAAVTEQLVRTLGPDDSPAQLVAASLATAMARGGENEFRDACHEVRKVAGGLWDVPRQRTALLAAVLDAELRIMSDKEAKRLNTSFQELLSSLDVSVPETLEWWHRAQPYPPSYATSVLPNVQGLWDALELGTKAPDAEASGSPKETQEGAEAAPKAPSEVEVVATETEPPAEPEKSQADLAGTGPGECPAPDASPAEASPEASQEASPEASPEASADADTTDGAKAEAEAAEAEKSPSVQPGHESKDGTLLAEHEHEHEETDGEEHEFGETAHLVELEAEEDPEFEQEDVNEEDAEEEEEEVYKEEELGPPINIYKPVTPYEVNWEITEVPAEGSGGGTQGSRKVGKVVKPKVSKGRCQWRNPVGFMCSTDTSEAAEHEPWPNDMYAVYTSTQGGDSKDMSWVEGVTLLSSEGHNIMAFILLMAFLRDHQELYVDVDLMDGRIYSMKGPGGLELTPAEDQVLLCEDIEVINDVRKALSEAFYSKASPKITTVEQEDGIDFSGTRGRRDDEPVPQVAAEPRVSEALDRLFAVLRECSTRMESIDEETWNQRIRLSKPTRQMIPLHQQSSRKAGSGSSDALFTLFEPLTDLAQARAAAERQEQEEAERRRKAEEEKRRRKEMERQAKEEARRQKQQEQQRAREEAKRAKGKGKGKDEAKGKGKKDRKQQNSYGQQYQQYQPQQQPQQPQQQQQQNSKKGRRERGSAQSSAASSSDAQALQQVYTMPDLPADWVAVPDQQTGRPYFWNPTTNEVTWTKPGQPMMMPPMPAMFQPPMFFQQQ